MKRAIALTIAALTTACGGAKLTAEEARNALPSASNVQITTPTSSGQALTAGGSSETSFSVLGGQSDYYALTRGVSLTVNVGVGLWIGLLEFVVHLPPTSCSGDTCTWGPWTSTDPLSPPNTYKLTVTKSEGGGTHYDYSFQGATTSSGPFVEVVSGVAYPSGQPLHGHGSFVVDFDKTKLVNPTSNDTGTLTVNHDNVSSLKIDCSFQGATEHGLVHHGEKMNVVYAFDQNSAGGDLQVGLHYVDSDAAFKLHSRWSPNGAGRADVRYEVPTPAFDVSECWSSGTTGFITVYSTTLTPSGDETQCAFASAPATIQVP